MEIWVDNLKNRKIQSAIDVFFATFQDPTEQRFKCFALGYGFISLDEDSSGEGIQADGVCVTGE